MLRRVLFLSALIASLSLGSSCSDPMEEVEASKLSIEAASENGNGQNDPCKGGC